MKPREVILGGRQRNTRDFVISFLYALPVPPLSPRSLVVFALLLYPRIPVVCLGGTLSWGSGVRVPHATVVVFLGVPYVRGFFLHGLLLELLLQAPVRLLPQHGHV